jgi:hypothetical protein
MIIAKNLIRKNNSANQGRSFTSVQMVHTHTVGYVDSIVVRRSKRTPPVPE